MTETNLATENIQRDAAIVAKPNLDALSSADFPEYAGIIPTQEVKVEEVKKEEIIEEGAPKDIVLEENKPVVEEVKEVVEEVKKEEELILDGVKPLELTLETTEPEEGSWIAYAKNEGLEIVEDTPEAYIEAKTKPLLEQIETIKNAKSEEYLSDIDPKIRMEIELNKSGMSYEQIKAPLENIAKFVAMDDTALYREDLLTRYDKATAEWIDAEVEKAIESGQVTHEATRIRLELNAAKEHIELQREQIVEKYKANKDSFLASQRTQEIESVTKAMNDMSSLMGKSIPEDIRKQLGVNYSKGEYDQILKDPKAIAEFIAYKKLGQQITKNIETESFNKGRLESAKKLHNTPPVDAGGAGTPLQTNKTGDKNFDNLSAEDFGLK